MINNINQQDAKKKEKSNIELLVRLIGDGVASIIQNAY